MAQYEHQADQNDLEKSFEVIPAGSYTAVIEESDYLQNKKQTGNIIKLTYQIIEGPLKGSKIFENLNVENSNSQAEQIAKRTLNSICMAVGVNQLHDTQELHNIPFRIEVAVKDSEIYGKQNQIKKHLPLNEATPAPANQMPAPPNQSATSDQHNQVKKHPWQK